MYTFKNKKILKKNGNRLIFTDNFNKKRNVYYGGMDPEKIFQILGKKPESIIEFGSYDGGDGLKYKLDFPNALVVSVEACPNLFADLSYLDFFEVKRYNYLISDMDGKKEFFQSKTKADSMSAPVGSELVATKYIREKNRHLIYEKKPLLVPSITLESLINQKLKKDTVDFLHIDTQGTFLKIIHGLGKIKPLLIFAEIGMKGRYVGADSMQESDELMKKRGYKKISQNGFDAVYLFIGDKQQ